LGFLEFAPDARPLASTPPGWRYTALGGSLIRERRWQNVGYFEVRHPDLADADVRARLAFTFCAVWQDALPSLFPGQAQRLAVLSPQAAGLPEPENDVDRFYRRLYPAWTGARAADEPVLQIYLFEDADHDLGVVRAQVQPEGLEITWAVLRDYLHWAQDQPPERLYQTYGGGELPGCLDYPGVRKLLESLIGPWASPVTTPGPGASTTLTPVAESAVIPAAPHHHPVISGMAAPAFCDFCAAPLGSSGVTLDDDERQRCYRCGQDAIDTLAAFRRLWDEVVEGMEGRYDLILPEAIRMRFAPAAEVARQARQHFQATSGSDQRTVGLLVPAWCDTPTLWLENGAPRLSVMEILVRELTHLWQADQPIRHPGCPVELLEGQALYTAIDYLTVHGGEPLAAWRRRQATGDDPERHSPAARGYRQIAPHCPADPQALFPHFRRLLENMAG
jgi:hypothetical protein